MRRLVGKRLRSVFERLDGLYGDQQWWPGDSAFEIMVGAVLTQNTAWANVERAIQNLKADASLEAETIAAMRHPRLARLIRPSGYYNIKAKRLRNLCRWYLDQGGFRTLAERETPRLRRDLLSVNGVGEETADDILLYAFDRPVFVVDAYTRRIFARLGMIQGDEGYDTLRRGIEQALGPDVPLYNQYHALIVRHGKDICRKRPRCEACCIKRICREKRR